MNPIFDKIKKLLRLAKNSAATAEEASLALQKAMKLAKDNGIDLSAIPPDDPLHGGMTHATEPSQAGLPHRLASRLVKRHFSVDTLFDSTGAKPVIHFIGFETNVQLAQYCYVYLVRAMRAAWRKRTNRRLRDRDSFLRGYFYAIDDLMPETFHQPGLIISSGNYVEAVIFGGRQGISIKSTSSKPSKISEAAFYNGHRAGSAAGIRNGLRGSETLNLE